MKRILVLILVLSTAVYSQDKSDLKLTGTLSLDSKLAINEMNFQNYFNDEQNNAEKKSPYLAAALSFVLPGAGEYYSENYLKSAIFLAAEVTAITVGLIYDKKGDDQTISFQNYANQHWSAKRYAEWTVVNAQNINSSVDPSQYNVFKSDGSVNWSELNRLENAIGSFYSHRLDRYGEQQYYEMIGKYQQFYQGWEDADPTLTTYEDIKERLSSSPSMFIYYSGERGKANDFYSAAHTAVLVVVANHILSALDAAWSASRYNKNLELSTEVKKFDLGFRTIYYPRLNLQYRF